MKQSVLALGNYISMYFADVDKDNLVPRPLVDEQVYIAFRKKSRHISHSDWEELLRLGESNNNLFLFLAHCSFFDSNQTGIFVSSNSVANKYIVKMSELNIQIENMLAQFDIEKYYADLNTKFTEMERVD